MVGNRLTALSVLVAALVLAACSGVRELDEPALPLTRQEAEAVERQVERARTDGEWRAAWSQAIDLGGDRRLLEGIALDALEDQAGDAEEMFELLRDKWGGLTEDGQARVGTMTVGAQERGLWNRAAEIQLAVAGDAPAYAGAWAVYEAAPSWASEGVLERIREAREDLEETDPSDEGR